MDGRDLSETVVLTDASLKLFMTASDPRKEPTEGIKNLCIKAKKVTFAEVAKKNVEHRDLLRYPIESFSLKNGRKCY